MFVRRLVYSFALFLIMFCGKSQNQVNYWYFGEYAGISFSSGFPVALVNGQINTLEGCSAISSSSGELLFYSDGSEVWDKNHNIMPNGSGLMGNFSSTQSAIIVPNPSYDNIYYIFTVDAEENNLEYGLRYSEVNMNLNNGLGDVTSRKNILLVAPSCEKVTAVGHGSENITWVITHLWNSNSFFAFKVYDFGVNSNPVISSVGDTIGDLMVNSKGYLKVSPDGTWIAMANNTLQTLLIFDFDNETGVISNQIRDNRFSDAPFPYGIEFSPNSELLYVTNWSWSGLDTKIYQYDLTASTPEEILNSRVEIASSVDLFGALQLGPDNRIYAAQEDNMYLGVINDPNARGIACDFQFNGVYLAGKISHWGLPPFIQSFFNLNADFRYESSCLGDETLFFENCSQDPDSVFWEFGDIAAGIDNYSTLLNPVHIFTSTGFFNVTLRAYFEGYTDSISKIVVIHEKPQVDLGNDTAFCHGESFILDAGSGYATYLWNNVDTAQIINIDTSGIYWVEVSNEYGCVNGDTIELSFHPIGYSIIDTIICQGESILIGGLLLNTSGVYYDTLSSIYSCDSIITINLSVADIFNIMKEEFICKGDSIFLEGNWQSGAGLYTDPYLSVDGCDSIVITSLMVHDTFRLLKETGICTGDSIWAGGGWQYESGIFHDIYLSVNGCDSLITTILTVDSIIHASFLESICQGDSFFTGGAYQNSGGIYFDTSVSQMGCDSFSVTHLIVYETYNLQIDTGICQGDSILIGNIFSHEAGLYQDMYSSMFGCDSVVMIRLSVEPAPLVFIGNDTIVRAGTELLLDASYPGAAYLWQDGSTGATYIVKEEGLYYVIVTGECGNDQDSINVEYRDFNCNLFMPNAFTPNGDGLNDIFLPKTNCITIEFELIISDRWGKMVFTTNNKDKGWDGMVNNEIAPTGIYSWILSYKAVLYEEVINNKEHGVVVLIR